MNNPFLISGYISPKYFCNRENETHNLIQNIKNKRNTTLISQRRIGKTGLLKHVKYILEHENKRIQLIYVDLLPALSGKELIQSLATALVRINFKEQSFVKKLLTLLGSLRPVISFDSLTGLPNIEVGIEKPNEISEGFASLLRYFSNIKMELVVMMDEFQQINRFPEQNMEAILRSVIQEFPTISFIFSGSNKHMLESMFASSKRPFYQSTSLMYLEKIKRNEYKNFIINKFLTHKKEIQPAHVDQVLDWCRLHTFYVQVVCNRLFNNFSKKTSKEYINETISQLLSEQDSLYLSYRNMLPPHQFKLIKAIALEKEVKQPTSGSFINKHKLNSASSVSTSIKALIEKELIYLENNSYQVSDVFFSNWLEYHYS